MMEMPSGFLRLAEQPYQTTIHLSDGTFVKAYKVRRANTGLPQHSHAYSHTSYIATGSVKAWKDGQYVGTVVAPDGILIEAHAKHFFQTLEDNTTILCIHSLADGDEPEIEDHHVVEMLDAPAAPRPRPQPSSPPLDGFTFAAEDFDGWLADAQPLFRRHMTATGQDPDRAMMKNFPLLKQLTGVGATLITTARQNGRMFAYLLAILTPTLDEAGVLTAHLMLPFASPDAPGIGRKLHAAMIDMLREKGVSQVLARAGVRGDGPRLGSLYQRLGFVPDGALYRLDL
jgi:GNAT superfamily N-acetyltransferase